MYLVNQRIILLIKMTTLLGIPLLSSFVVPWLSFWKLPSVLLVLVAFYLNNLYPDRIQLDDSTVKIKIFLSNQWLEYSPQQMQFRQRRHCIYLYVDEKPCYRLSMERLSLRLYRQLTELLVPYQEADR